MMLMMMMKNIKWKRQKNKNVEKQNNIVPDNFIGSISQVALVGGIDIAGLRGA